MTPVPATSARTLMRVGRSIALLMLVWLLWSGYFKTLLVALGLLSCGLVTLLSWRMGNIEQESAWQRILLRLPRFWLWLGKEVVKSNLEVARLILSPRLDLAPRLVTIEAQARDEFGQALFGNSITLTPGTLTLDITGGRLRVHCLTQAGAVALAEGEMNRRIAALTGR